MAGISQKTVDIIQTLVLFIIVAVSWGFVVYAGRQAALRQYPELQNPPPVSWGKIFYYVSVGLYSAPDNVELPAHHLQYGRCDHQTRLLHSWGRGRYKIAIVDCHLPCRRAVSRSPEVFLHNSKLYDVKTECYSRTPPTPTLEVQSLCRY